METVYIRFKHNQVGCLVEASYSDPFNWQGVELLKYGGTLDTAITEANYLATLKQKGIRYVVVMDSHS